MVWSRQQHQVANAVIEAYFLWQLLFYSVLFCQYS
jgi:hypothetical protein